MQNDETKPARSVKLVHSSFFIHHSAFVLIALLVLGVRLPRLGERPMHTDEAVNAYRTGELLAGESFHYDPQDRHGPALFALAEPLVKLCGAKTFSELTETQLRLSSVLAGMATVLLFGAGVEMFGFIPCLIAALLFACAPLPVYYSRYFIHETLFVAATLGLILSGGRALKANSISSAALAGFCAALMLASKETAVIHFFAIGMAGLIGWRFNPQTNFPKPKTIFTASLVFFAVIILLFTWFGQHWAGPADLFRAIPHLAARAGGEGHAKPFWYYLILLGGGWSGAAMLALAAPGFFCPRGSAGRIFLVIYALLVAVIYSAIPYKTPWLALNLWLPLTILAGMTVEWIWLSATKFSIRTAILACLAGLGFLIAHDTRKWVFLLSADETNPYAYAHTGEDLPRLPERMEKLARPDAVIAVIAADPWPLPWYLRKFSRVGYWQPGQNPGAADFYLTSPEVAETMKAQLTGWRPEFFGGRPGTLVILWSPEAKP